MSDSIDNAIDAIRSLQFEKARDLLNAAISSGNNDAYYYLGQVYILEPQKNPILDYALGFDYLKKCFNTTKMAEAQISIADLYRYGHLGEMDYLRAMKNYLEVIRQGYTANGYLFWAVGIIYMNGAHGVNRDLEAAEHYFRKGIKSNHLPSYGALGSVLMKKGFYIKGILVRIKALLLTFKWMIFDRNPDKARMT